VTTPPAAPHPLINHVVIGGLRAYAPQPETIELAPLTLVFGPNSAGKSTLISAVTLLAQSISPSPSRVLVMNGPLVDGGSFRMAVHRHDEQAPLTLGLGFQRPPGMPSRGDDGQREVQVQYRWDPTARIPTARTLRLQLQGKTTETPLPVQDETPEDALRRTVMLDELAEVLSRVAYLGPLRARPERTHNVGLGLQDYVGPQGEGLAEVLDARRDVLEQTNEWMGRLGVGYQMKLLTPQSRDVVVTAGDFSVVGLLDIRQQPPVLVSARAVGFGVGQLAPVVAQCLLSRQGCVIVEQPEVHIHPRLQAAVGDLFIHSVLEQGNQLLVETHSEHLMLRLLRRVREGVIRAEDIAVLYVETHEDGNAFVRRLDIDPDGELAGGWPGGFFAERMDELVGGMFGAADGSGDER
jgi:energy-coupling factor transporter ATP-binding protein EcfA2